MTDTNGTGKYSWLKRAIVIAIIGAVQAIIIGLIVAGNGTLKDVYTLQAAQGATIVELKAQVNRLADARERSDEREMQDNENK